MKVNLHYLTKLFPAILLITFSLQACGRNGEDTTVKQEYDPYLEQFKENLTSFEQQHGIGPITERLEIDDEINEDMVMRGREIFKVKCESCHTLQEDKIGPSLGEVVERRSPEFVMNFILNPGENILNHPVGLELLAEHHIEMPYRDVTVDEARAIYEHLRDYYNTR